MTLNARYACKIVIFELIACRISLKKITSSNNVIENIGKIDRKSPNYKSNPNGCNFGPTCNI